MDISQYQCLDRNMWIYPTWCIMHHGWINGLKPCGVSTRILQETFMLIFIKLFIHSKCMMRNYYTSNTKCHKNNNLSMLMSISTDNSSLWGSGITSANVAKMTPVYSSSGQCSTRRNLMTTITKSYEYLPKIVQHICYDSVLHLFGLIHLLCISFFEINVGNIIYIYTVEFR